MFTAAPDLEESRGITAAGAPDPPYPKQTKGKLELSSFTRRHTSVFVTGREYILKLTFLMIVGIQSYQRKLKYE